MGHVLAKCQEYFAKLATHASLLAPAVHGSSELKNAMQTLMPPTICGYARGQTCGAAEQGQMACFRATAHGTRRVCIGRFGSVGQHVVDLSQKGSTFQPHSAQRTYQWLSKVKPDDLHDALAMQSRKLRWATVGPGDIIHTHLQVAQQSQYVAIWIVWV